MTEELRGLVPLTFMVGGDVWIKDAADVDEFGQVCMLANRLYIYETHVPALLEEVERLGDLLDRRNMDLDATELRMNSFAEDNARLQSELSEARERAEKAEGCIAKASRECNHWRCAVKEWRGPQGREGAGND